MGLSALDRCLRVQPPNQMLQQTGAAILLLRGLELLPTAPAAELRCSGARLDRVRQVFRCNMLFIMVRELLRAYCKHLSAAPGTPWPSYLCYFYKRYSQRNRER